MSAMRYRKFFRLCEEWPLDNTKHGRDLAVVIRQKIAEAFKMGETSRLPDEAKCDRAYESLQKLNTDFYRTKYSSQTVTRNAGATGVSYKDCKVIMSTDVMKELQD